MGDALDRHAPALVESSVGKAIVHVTAGNEFTAALTDTGEVCGNGVAEKCSTTKLIRDQGYVKGCRRMAWQSWIRWRRGYRR